MQDYVTPLPFAILLLAHGACLAAVVAILNAPAPVRSGWRVLGPSGTHWFCFAGSWAFAAVISWVWLFVGSARADADAQMRIALLLALVFCAAAAWSGFQIAALRRMALRWRGGEICWRERGRELSRKFAEFDAVRRTLDGTFQIRFADRTLLKIDPYAQHATEFLARFSEEIGRDVY